MTPITQMTIGELASSIRDATIIAATILVGWKARGWIQPCLDFFKKADTFMDSMTLGMNILLTNHLPHLQKDLKNVCKHRGQCPFDIKSKIDEPLEVVEGNDAIRQ